MVFIIFYYFFITSIYYFYYGIYFWLNDVDFVSLGFVFSSSYGNIELSNLE